MNRRNFLSQSTSALAALGGTAVWANPKDQRPNIFFAIADDHSWLHMGAAGDEAVRTPTMDRVARDGVRFTNSYCASPSCTPSRAAVLTGQHVWRLKESGNLWSTLRKNEYTVYPDLLEKAGYEVGLMRKGWGPGNFRAGGFERNPAGPDYKNFDQFLTKVPDGKPFCFWFGTSDPHRPYEPGSGIRSGIDPKKVTVPPFWPDTPEVRGDICDYLFEVQRWDRELGQALALMEKAGRLDNTIVVITSDNGMPFPRAKANLYDYGARMPLLVQWRSKVNGGRVCDDFVSHTDFAPTFLEACGLKAGKQMTGRSMVKLLQSNKSDPSRSQVIFGRERHTTGSKDKAGYPSRAIRTGSHLYIRNYEPEWWPVLDPPTYQDCDDGPVKRQLVSRKDDPETKRFFDLCFAKRPAEELYDVAADPGQINNLAADPAQRKTKEGLAARLTKALKATGDPRETGGEKPWPKYEYYGPSNFDLR